MHKKPKLIRKGQGGLSLPAFEGLSVNGALSVDPLFASADLSNAVENPLFQNLLSQSDKAKGLTNFFGSAGALGKANSFLDKSVLGLGSVGGITNSVLGVADKFIPQAQDKGSKITSGVFNGLSKAAGFIPGVGTAASVALKGLGTLFGAGVKKIKGNTTNELVDSSASYTGADAYDSKRFGLLGLGSAAKYKRKVARRENERNTAYNILQEGKDDLLASTNVQQMQLADNLNKNGSDWMYNTHYGKLGMKIKEAKRLSSLYKKKINTSGEPIKSGTTELRNGGNITSVSSLEASQSTSTIAVNQSYQSEESGQQSSKKLQNGGEVNVIPEGALHARKHDLVDINPKLEGITPKGIPVITQEDGGIVQHAEIECNELILRLEATNKIENLRKLYTKSKNPLDKDNIAIEAGKLLTYEIINNTDDRTGLMNNV